MRKVIAKLVAAEELNFLLTNRIPRRWATILVGRISHSERRWIAKPAIALWRLFCDVDLSDAADSDFASMHACFIRKLRSGSRPFVPGEIGSPSDAILGANGVITHGQAFQLKGAPYALEELLGDAAVAARFEGGCYATLRLTAGMYHRFHAPADLSVERITYLSGDCWNVNTPALKRVERLFCKNERAAIHCRLADETPLILVAVAAVLVASIRLTFLDTRELLRSDGPRSIALDAKLAQGDEMGWFEHGSTIIVLAPAGLDLAPGLNAGDPLLAGRKLLEPRALTDL